jgi:hypothetical protein
VSSAARPLLATCATSRFAGHADVVSDGPRTSFAAVAGVVEVLAGSLIPGDLQARLTVTRAAKQRPAATPTSLREGTNLTTPATPVSFCCFSRLWKCLPDDDGGLGDGRQSVRVVRLGMSMEAREVTAGGLPMDAGRGT